MSLHLIESSSIPTRSTRKRFGATASLVLHAALVVGAFTAASAAPVVDEPAVVTDLLYVAPPPRPVEHVANAAKSSNATPSPAQLALPALPQLSTIPVEIPPINPDGGDITLARPFDRGFTGGGTGTATGIASPYGSGPSGNLLSENEVDRQVMILSGYRTPRYPESMRSAGIEETLNATFVVDTLGKVEPGSLEIPAAQHPQFVVAVREALANARFRPAESHGRRVRQRVVQAFVFSLQRN